MELGHLAVRAVAAYIFLLALVRSSGKRSVKHATAFSFTISLVLGDLVDNAIFAEVPFAEFAVAAAVIAGIHIAMDVARSRV
jgi:uncharacterized membrane protein YcaP (DUF421 family)